MTCFILLWVFPMIPVLMGDPLFCSFPDLFFIDEQGRLALCFRKVNSIPVILTGGITEPQAAEQFLSAGKADLIGVGRAVLKNPEWAKQAIEALSHIK
ncbi:MAG: tRNA-dihydrouridine synthase [Deltaproteobacteria bacterium]|nr:tRNA-dihydrouridine synthase [Deltaproteobacteria bacterium]